MEEGQKLKKGRFRGKQNTKIGEEKVRIDLMNGMEEGGRGKEVERVSYRDGKRKWEGKILKKGGC